MEFLEGTINTVYGIYKNHCCGDEFVLYRGITFPKCKKHQEITTRWHMVGTISIGRTNEGGTSGNDPNSGSPAA
ncbi:MAG TPA: hypothetical protein VKY31_02400 [Terriglobia bacterium]|nr:hypothetical protein [Terriglobia bacterium]